MSDLCDAAFIAKSFAQAESSSSEKKSQKVKESKSLKRNKVVRRRVTLSSVPAESKGGAAKAPDSAPVEGAVSANKLNKAQSMRLGKDKQRISLGFFQYSSEKFSPEGLLTWDNLVGETGEGRIINMEDDDDDLSDQETSSMNVSSALGGIATEFVHGMNRTESEAIKTPYENLRDLLCHHAYLAVFLNYVVSNSEPAPLFFYLITDVYKEGQVKEMQRWAYEIHSSFLVPNAPLRVPNIEDSIIQEIDRALHEDFDKETVLRKLFWKAKAKARKILKEQLSEFRDKLTAGLGSMFGPPDHELKECIENPSKELQIIEKLLLPVLDNFSDDLENATDCTLTKASSLATILSKTFKMRSQNAATLIEKCPTFVSKERKPRMFGRNRKTIQVHGHHFEPMQYCQVTYCNHSQNIIWGIAPQGYHCSSCGFDVHKKFVQQVEETCVGPASLKQRNKSKNLIRFIPDIVDKRPGGRESSSFFHVFDDTGDAASKQGEKGSFLASRLAQDAPEPEPEKPQSPRAEASPTTTNLDSPTKMSDRWQHDRNQLGAAGGEQSQRSGVKVDRSQSCKIDKKDPKRGTTRERRKHSDPSIPRTTASDVDTEAQPSIANHHSVSSSTSSLSARSSLDSPAGSTQEMTHGKAVQPSTSITSTTSFSTIPSNTSTTTLSDVLSHYQPSNYDDSDFETELDPPDWRRSLSTDELAKLKPKERKRQDVINEFFQTERSHVRNLKVLDRLFYRPLVENSHMPKELIDILFPNLDDVLTVHTKYNQKMKERTKAGFPIGNVGDILLDMFEGPNGDKLITVGSEFTKNQKFSIEELKDRRKKDHKLDQFLSEQEKRPECRRLQLPSILPMEHQRLVKYPLLLEQLLKQCERESDPEEYDTVKKCVDRTREILESIDRQVAEAQNIQRLAEIQRNLDTSGLEKLADSAICAEYRNIDLTKHRLIYDGPLTLKLGDTKRFKTVELHVLLLEDCIMLIQKQDDRYYLKFHTSTTGNTTVGGQGNKEKYLHSPVIKLSTMIVRPVATDKRAFYLLNTTQNGPQIYELVASSTADRSQWIRHITEGSNAYKSKDSRRSYRGTIGSESSQNGLDSGSKSELQGDSLDLGDKKGQPAGRSQSFHEQSVSNMDQHRDRHTTSSRDDQGDAFASKTGGEDSSNGDRKKLQRVEIMKIAEPCPLIDPSQVVITQGEILVADPVLTPIEKLRRKDLEVAKALEEKQRLIADILQIPVDDFEHIADIAAQPSPDKDAREVLLAALAQAKSLADLVNESLNLSEEDTVLAMTSDSCLSSPSKEAARGHPQIPGPPTEKLIAITTNMNQHLTSLLAIIQEKDDERERLRRELLRSQEQVHALLSQSSVRTSSLSATSPASRPASFISVEESSAADADISEKNQESEDDANPTKTSEEVVSGDSPLINNDNTLTEDIKAGTDSDEQEQFAESESDQAAKNNLDEPDLEKSGNEEHSEC